MVSKGRLQSALLELRGILLQPGMADRKHVVRVPKLVRVVTLDDPRHFSGDICRGCGVDVRSHTPRASTNCTDRDSRGQ